MGSAKSLLFRSFLLILLPLIASSRGSLRTLDEETWRDMLVGEWMVEFFAPWCPACRQLEPVWKEFAGWGDDLGIEVGAIDVTTNPGLSGRFAITALPTLFHVKDGVFRLYKGQKRKEDFISFIEDAKWKDIEPVPAWKSPQSVPMSGLAHFFKLSMFLRNVHNEIVEYGVPYWGSYILFGLATILLGTFLGLLIVCIIDYTCPGKKTSQQVYQKQLEVPAEKLEEHVDEEIKEGDDDSESSGSDEKEEEEEAVEEEEEAVEEEGTEELGSEESSSRPSSGRSRSSTDGNTDKEESLRKRVIPKTPESGDQPTE